MTKVSEARTVRTACPYCGVGCGILARRGADGTVTVTGDPDHPANRGRLCSKGAALAETLSLEGRLLHPEIDGRTATWDDALATVANRFRDTLRRHGPGSIAFYVSGQLLTEDYYVANKLMKGYIGTANIDTNSRLCMASAVAGHRRAFGSDTVPGCYEDLEQADLVVLAGSNLAWCHPVLFDRLQAARAARGTKIVVLDPRRTVTADAADLHLALAPGSDVALFNGLLAWLHDNGASDADFVERHTVGLEQALAASGRASTPAAVAAWTGLSVRRIEAFYRLFAATPRTVTVYSQGVNQSTSGADKVNAIINCHLLTGRIGRPGTGPFSVTGQHNAMGGREVGGFATALAAHMEIGDAEHRKRVQSFWRSPAIPEQPGLKAIDLFRAVADGRIRALWVMATNPVASLPDAGAVAAALERCPFVVVSENVRCTDTTRRAHVLLPALAWGEKDGTVTNSERRVSRQRRFLPAPGEARPDWWIVCRVARRMGFAGFDFTSPAEIFDEHCRLTALGNDGERALDLSGLVGLGAAGYETLVPVQWPIRVGPKHDDGGAHRFFAEGGFFTPDRRARFVPVSQRPPASQTDADYPLILNTGRLRDQWHTMARTGKAARLSAHVAEPFIEIHPADAARYGIASGAIAGVESVRGAVLLRARLSEQVRRGQVFAPIHWTDEHAARARVDTLVAAHTDPVSGQPESKLTPVRVTPFAAAWHAFGVARERPRPERELFTIDSEPAWPAEARHAGDRDLRVARMAGSYWAVAAAAGGWRIELAGRRGPDDWEIAAGRLFGCDVDREDTLALNDPAMGTYRLAIFDGDQLRAALFVSREALRLSRAWAIGQLARAFTAETRLQVLAAGRATSTADEGEILCACLHVGVNEIAAAVARGARTVADVGAATRAGTNCGSCRPEIAGIIEGNGVRAAG